MSKIGGTLLVGTVALLTVSTRLCFLPLFSFTLCVFSGRQYELFTKQSKTVHAVGGYVLMGGWAFFANRAHEMPAPLVSGVVQGVFTATIRLFPKTLNRRHLPSCYRMVAHTGTTVRSLYHIACFTDRDP